MVCPFVNCPKNVTTIEIVYNEKKSFCHLFQTTRQRGNNSMGHLKSQMCKLRRCFKRNKTFVSSNVSCNVEVFLLETGDNIGFEIDT